MVYLLFLEPAEFWVQQVVNLKRAPLAVAVQFMPRCSQAPDDTIKSVPLLRPGLSTYLNSGHMLSRRETADGVLIDKINISLSVRRAKA